MDDPKGHNDTTLNTICHCPLQTCQTSQQGGKPLRALKPTIYSKR